MVATRICCCIVHPIFHLINSPVLTVYRLFLQKNDITLKRLQQASHFCGNIPRPCFKAALSSTAIFDAKEEIKEAIENTNDLFDVIHNAKRGNLSHRAFQIQPSPKSRFLGSCLVQPVSAWAFKEMLNLLHLKNRDEAYRFYCTIKGYPDSSQLRGRIFESCFHRYLNDSRTFIIKPLNNLTATPEIKFTVNNDSHLSFPDLTKLSEQLELSIKSDTSCYFQPESAIFPSFDSFLYQPKISNHNFSPLIALQVTTAACHGIKIKDLQKVQSSLDLQNKFLQNL
ncbi:hypothetical protein APHAL10511_003097 [Amanita phalloides]|nr:hypothetical protein APHAL10511_003097 [Amanita phalloides]